MASETTGHMALVAEAYLLGDSRQGQLRVAQQVPGAFQAQLHDIAVQGEPRGLLEDLPEIGLLQAGLRRLSLL